MEIKRPVKQSDDYHVVDAAAELVCQCMSYHYTPQIVSALNAACQPEGESIVLSGKELEALKSMASVDFMIKACAGQLTPVGIAESINGILESSKNKAAARIEALEGASKKIQEGIEAPQFNPDQESILDTSLDLHEVQNAYLYGWECAMSECGEILAKAALGEKTTTTKETESGT
jgi:hypothetical protein